MRARIDNLKRKALGAGLGGFLVRAMAGSGAVQAAGMLATFLVGVQLARGLGVQGYGQYGIAMAVIALVSIPGEFGIPKLVTREVAAASARGDLPRLFGVLRWAKRMTLRVALPLAAVIAIGSWLMARHSDSAVAGAIAVGALLVPLVAISKIQGGALQGLRFVVLGQIPFHLLRPFLLSALLFGLFLLRPDASPADAMALNLVTALAALLLGHSLLRARLPTARPGKAVEDRKAWRASSIPMAMSEGLRILQPQIGVLLLGVLATDADAGLFRVAVATAAVVAVPLTLGNLIAAPIIARLHAEGDQRRLQLLCTHTAQAMAAGVLALGLPLVIAGPWLVGLIFGIEFEPAYAALLLLCAGQFITGLFGANIVLLNMIGHEGRVTRAMGVALAVNVGLALVLLPLWGATGAAAAFTASLIVWNLTMWGDARKLAAIETSIVAPRGGR